MLSIKFPSHKKQTVKKEQHTADDLLMMDVCIPHQTADRKPSAETSMAHASYWFFSLMSQALGCRAPVNKLLCQP